MKRTFNDWLGDNLAYWLSTMACFYIISALVIIPLYWQRPSGLVPWMQYIISVFFQGTALPVLGYVSRKAGECNEKITQETHDTVMAQMQILTEQLEFARKDHEDQNHIMEEQNVIIDDLKHILNDLHEKTVN